MRKSAMLLAVAILLVACSEKPAEESLLGRVVQPVMIGATLQYLENLTGPPLNVSFDGSRRTYKVDGCEVTVVVAGGEHKSVTSLRLVIAPGCDTDLGKFLPAARESQSQPASRMTFGKFETVTGGGSVFLADCLSGCGNASDPVVYRHWRGSRADDFLEMVLEVTLAEGDSLDAARQWKLAMEEGEGEEWVIDGQFNCVPEKYGDVARRVFAAVQGQAITIGRDLELPVCEQSVPSLAGGEEMVRVPPLASDCDYDYAKKLANAGLLPKEVSVHGPEDEDFPGYACPYRIVPTPGTLVPRGSSVEFRSAWEAG